MVWTILLFHVHYISLLQAASNVLILSYFVHQPGWNRKICLENTHKLSFPTVFNMSQIQLIIRHRSCPPIHSHTQLSDPSPSVHSLAEQSFTDFRSSWLLWTWGCSTRYHHRKWIFSITDFVMLWLIYKSMEVKGLLFPFLSLILFKFFFVDLLEFAYDVP